MRLAISVVAAGALALPAGAAATGTTGATGATGPRPVPRTLSVGVDGLSGGRVSVLRRVRAAGTVKPFVSRERVLVTLWRDGRALRRKRVAVRKRGSGGTYSFRTGEFVRPGTYVFTVTRTAKGEKTLRSRSRRFRVRYPDLDFGERSRAVRVFNRLLRAQAYFVTPSARYDNNIGRAVLAFHKVNRLPRTMDATARDFETLAAGKGGFRLRHRRRGRYAEASVAKQVLVLAQNGKPAHIFHISTGKPSTPSDFGRFRFYTKQPGYNGVGMYYSVYYNRGEATHGYKSVPTYAASHGCLRNPPPNSKFIYRWIPLGAHIWVYY